MSISMLELVLFIAVYSLLWATDFSGENDV